MLNLHTNTADHSHGDSAWPGKRGQCHLLTLRAYSWTNCLRPRGAERATTLLQMPLQTSSRPSQLTHGERKPIVSAAQRLARLRAKPAPKAQELTLALDRHVVGRLGAVLHVVQESRALKARQANRHEADGCPIHMMAQPKQCVRSAYILPWCSDARARWFAACVFDFALS